MNRRHLIPPPLIRAEFQTGRFQRCCIVRSVTVAMPALASVDFASVSNLDTACWPRYFILGNYDDAWLGFNDRSRLSAN